MIEYDKKSDSKLCRLSWNAFSRGNITLFKMCEGIQEISGGINMNEQEILNKLNTIEKIEDPIEKRFQGIELTLDMINETITALSFKVAELYERNKLNRCLICNSESDKNTALCNKCDIINRL